MSSTSSWARCRLGLSRVLLERAEPVGVEDELGRVRGQDGEVAVPEADELQRVVERLGGGAAVGAARPFRELRLAALVLLLGQELQLLLELLLHLGLRVLARLLGAIEQLAPRLLVDRAVDRRPGVALRRLPQLQAVAGREPDRLLAVAQAEPRRRFRGVRREALVLEPLRELRGGGRVEPHRLAAGGDRRQHLRRAVREQEQHHVRRRLLQRLEQRVGRLVVHHVHALEHEDPMHRLERRVRRRPDDRVRHVPAEHLVRARGRDPGQVGMAAVLGPDLDVRRVLRPLGEELAGEGARDVSLAAACRAVEQVRVGGRVLQRRPEDGFGVGVGGEIEHVPLILVTPPARLDPDHRLRKDRCGGMVKTCFALERGIRPRCAAR